MSEEMQRELGKHGAEIQALQTDMRSLVGDVREIRDTLSQAKGGWKTLLLVAGAAGAAGALVAKIAPFLGMVAR